MPASRVVEEQDLVTSIADALQFISYFHPENYIRSLAAAYVGEKSPAARNAIAQILINSRMAALARRPICQDTGVATVFMRIGAGIRIDTARSLDAIVEEAVRLAWLEESNPLRASMVSDPLFERKNTRDNTPANLYVELTEGDRLEVHVAAKGGGSENKARFTTLNPTDSVADWVVRSVETMGAGWCPPGLIGIGVGGGADKAMILAKQALFEPIDMPELRKRGPQSRLEELRLNIYERINALGIGAQGLGGLITVLDVKIRTFPAHAASLPVGLIPQCAADRHVQFIMDGSGPASFVPPPLDAWPDLPLDTVTEGARRVDLDRLSPAEVETWRAGETLLLTGHLFTGRDAAHKRMVDTLESGGALPVNLAGRGIYYVGPVDAVTGEVVGPAGPTTGDRMDKFTDRILSGTGLLFMVGKAERGPEAIDAIRRHRTPYLIAVGGAAYLVSKAVRASRIVAYEDLGMESMREFEVENMPVTVAVDVTGQSIHATGPRHWRRLHSA